MKTIYESQKPGTFMKSLKRPINANVDFPES